MKKFMRLISNPFTRGDIFYKLPLYINFPTIAIIIILGIIIPNIFIRWIFFFIGLLVIIITFYVRYNYPKHLEALNERFYNFLKCSRITLISGIFEDVDWENIYFSMYRLKNPTQSLPTFFLNLIDNPKEYIIDYQKYSGKYRRNQIGNKGTIYFNKRKFKYVLHKYNFEKKDNFTFKFSFIIVVIERFSFIYFSIPIDADRNQVFNDINIQPKAIYSNFPVISNKIYKLFTDLHQTDKSKIAFNPFSFRAFNIGLEEKNEFFQKVHNFPNQENEEKHRINPLRYGLINIHSDFLFFQSLIFIIMNDIRNPDFIINSSIKIENNLYVHIDPLNFLQDDSEEKIWSFPYIISELLKCLDQLQYELKNYHYNEFLLIKTYLLNVAKELTDSINIYLDFNHYFEFQDFSEEFNNFIKQLEVVRKYIELIILKTENNEITPLQDKETLINKLKSHLENTDFIYIRPLHKSGAWGIIHLIQNRYNDQKLALKLYKESLDEKKMDVFQNDIKNIYNIQHPNVVKIYSSEIFTFHDRNYGYIIMEYINGKTLSEVPSNIFQEQKSREDRISLFNIILETIEELRKNLNIHGDLHSGNILIENEVNNIKIIDPGFSLITNKIREDSDLIYITEDLLDYFFTSDEFNDLKLSEIRKFTTIADILSFFREIST